MAYRRLYLVIACSLTACAPDLPRDVLIDDRFDGPEETAILEMVAELNRVGQELLGRDFVAYRGRYADADGFTLGDPDDGRNVVYKLTEPDDLSRYLDETEGEEGSYIIGYSLHHDTLIMAFRLPYAAADGSICIPAIITEVDETDGGTGGGSSASMYKRGSWSGDFGPASGDVITGDCEAEDLSLEPNRLRQVFLHEMGHFIGLSHVKDPNALMYPYANGVQRFTDVDKRMICCTYACITDAYECDWNQVTTK